MRHRSNRGPSVGPVEDHRPSRILADPVATARTLSMTLPGAIDRAEAAGLSIIAQYLNRALHLAERIVASEDVAP